MNLSSYKSSKARENSLSDRRKGENENNLYKIMLNKMMPENQNLVFL